MKVCLICEGSYPYVMGGVSSWVQMLLKEYQDIEFVIWAIATNEKEMHEYKYKIPDNVKEIKKIYLTDRQFEKKHRRVMKLGKDQDVLRSLILDKVEDMDWNHVLGFLKRHRDDLVDILMSKDFFYVAVELYNREYSRTVFSSFLWNLRSMYFPLVAVLSGDFVQADIYHAVSTGYAGVLGGVASHIYGKPFLLTEHGIYTREREEEIIKSDWVEGNFKGIWIEFFNKLSHIAYQQATQVITLFETNKTTEVELGCPENKISIIPNGVDIKRFEKLPPRSEKSKSYINIGVVARVVPIKDIKTMLLAFDVVKRQVKNARLVILGPYDEDLEYYNECLALVNELQMQDVVFEGRVNINNYLSDFDIMLLTSISEGQPLAVLEGMAAKIPQVCTNVGSCKELLEGKSDDQLGKSGLIVPVMNIKAIANAVIELANDKPQRMQMGEIGCARVKKHYRKSVFLDQYHGLYKSLGGDQNGGNRV